MNIFSELTKAQTPPPPKSPSPIPEIVTHVAQAETYVEKPVSPVVFTMASNEEESKKEPVRSAPPPPVPEVPVVPAAEIQHGPILLTQQMALLTQMVSLMQQNMLTQHNNQPAQSLTKNTIKSRNPIFTQRTNHVTKRIRSQSPRKKLIQSNVVKSVNQSKSRKTRGLTLLEIGRSKPKKTDSKTSNSRLSLLDKKFVSRHVQEKQQKRQPKLEKFLQPKRSTTSAPKVKTSAPIMGPSKQLELEKENVPVKEKVTSFILDPFI